MTIIAETFVAGAPKTKGSLNMFGDTTRGRNRVTESVIGSKDWLRLMRDAVRLDRRHRGLTEPAAGPIGLRGIFYLPVDDVTQHNCGDLDKLLRNLGDALQAESLDGLARPIKGSGAISDDVQIVTMPAVKVSARMAKVTPGVLLKCWQVTPAEIEQFAQFAGDEYRAWMTRQEDLIRQAYIGAVMGEAMAPAPVMVTPPRRGARRTANWADAQAIIDTRWTEGRP